MYHVAFIYDDKDEKEYTVMLHEKWLSRETGTCRMPKKDSPAACKNNKDVAKSWLEYRFKILDSFCKLFNPFLSY